MPSNPAIKLSFLFKSANLLENSCFELCDCCTCCCELIVVLPPNSLNAKDAASLNKSMLNDFSLFCVPSSFVVVIVDDDDDDASTTVDLISTFRNAS